MLTRRAPVNVLSSADTDVAHWIALTYEALRAIIAYRCCLVFFLRVFYLWSLAVLGTPHTLQMTFPR